MYIRILICICEGRMIINYKFGWIWKGSTLLSQHVLEGLGKITKKFNHIVYEATVEPETSEIRSRC